jgi:hypothetical protein
MGSVQEPPQTIVLDVETMAEAGYPDIEGDS